jgi:hypothetical protein
MNKPVPPELHGNKPSIKKKKKKKKKDMESRAWWRMPLIPAFGRQRQADF